MTKDFNNKVLFLRRRFHEMESAVVAFSGGVDSSVLVKVAREELGDKMVAATAASASIPKKDRELAISFCKGQDIPHLILETDEMSDPAFTSNPENRCYYCKRHLYDCFVKLADRAGFKFVVEGTNASDIGGHRPGYKASKENERVATPLIEAGFTKEEVRRLARELNLKVADKPSSACLASRIPTGVAISSEVLRRIDAAEEILRKVGASQVRVRHHGDIARIEVDSKDMGLCIELRNEIVDEIKNLGWKFAVLDLMGYRER